MPRGKPYELEGLGQSERSRYAAHLDRGWQLFERGDLEGASTSASHAAELNDELPDAHMLSAAVEAARGELEASVRAYEQAIERDPEYISAYLAAGQLLGLDLDRPAEALELLEGAEDASDALPIDHLELALLQIECEWLLGNRDGVHARMRELEEAGALEGLRDTVVALEASEGDAFEAPESLLELFGGPDGLELEPDEPPTDEELEELRVRAATLILRLTRTWLDLQDAERALAWARGLVMLVEEEADAWHLLAEAHHRSGEAMASVHAAVQGYRLDHRDGAPEWAPEASDLHDLVQQALAGCSEPALRAALDANPFIVLIHEAPALELVLEGVDARAPALSLAAGGRRSGPTLTGLAVYRRNITRLCRGPEDFEAELRLAIFGELANALSLDDATRAKLGLPAQGPAPRIETLN